jgi:DNA-binding CsgD family transcriptional regulator
VKLSPRQTDILRLVAAGRTNKEAAAALGIAETTVEWHVANILVRLEASSRAEAVAIATREGMLDGSAPARARSEPASVSSERTVTLDVLGVRLGELTTHRPTRRRER